MKGISITANESDENRNKVSSLRITEIFYSLQGESSFVGLPTVFIRLTGCPLRCGYCDTAYAFSGGEYLSIDDILLKIKQYNTRYICVTGGEPLAQRGCVELLTLLCNDGYQVSLETSGSLDISHVDSRVHRIMDIKTPDSGEASKNKIENISFLTDKDELKFVICSRQDYEWSKNFVNQYNPDEKIQVLFSPVHTGVSPTTLADWILTDQLNVRFQFQLHKFLWNDEPGR